MRSNVERLEETLETENSRAGISTERESAEQLREAAPEETAPVKETPTENASTSASRPERTTMDGTKGVSGSPYWLLVCGTDRGPYGLEVLTLYSSGGEKTLPLFSCEEEAAAFLWTLAEGSFAEGGEWRARKTWGGELLSVLAASGYSGGPCAGVETVAFDPSPELASNSASETTLVGMGRKLFMERLMGRGRAWFDGASEG